MTSALKLFIDGHDRTGNLDPASVEIVRALNQRQNTASFRVYQTPLGGYYHNPATVPDVVSWWHMDEASGNLTDAVSGLTLTAQGSPTGYARGSLAPGYGGKAVLFDGVDDRFTSNAAGLRFAAPVSVGGWILSNSPTLGAPMVLADAANTLGADGWQLSIVHTNNYTSLAFVSDGASLSDPVRLFDRRPHFVVVTFSAGLQIKYYVDGELVSTDTDTASVAGAGSFALGGMASIPNNFFKGRMDEWFLCDGVLSADVIADLYAQGRSGVEHLHIAERSEVVITNEDGSRNRFGGYATSVIPFREGALDRGWEAQCVGWETRFESLLVEDYTGVNKRTDQIISEIFAADSELAGYDLTHVARGVQVPGVFRVRDRYLRDVMDELAKLDNDEWWINPNGTDLYKRRTNFVRTAAVRFTDDTDGDVDYATVFPCVDFKYNREFRNPINTAIIRGATRYEEWNPKAFGTVHQSGTGNAYRLDAHGLVPLESESEVVIQVNEGTAVSPSWSADLAVGRYGRDTLVSDGGNKDVLIQIIPRDADRLWFDATTAPPVHSANAYRVYGRIATKIRVKVQSAPALARMGGHRFDGFKYDEKLTSVDEARAAARRLIRDRSRPLEFIEWVSEFDPDEAATLLDVGDLVHLQNFLHGIDTRDLHQAGYRVQEIGIRLTPAGTIVHTALKVGTWKPQPIDLLRRLETLSQEASDFADDEEEYDEVILGWEGVSADTEDAVGIRDSLVVT